MNIKQAKNKFTELTGLPAKRKSISYAIRQYRGHYSHWLAYARGRFPDSRTEFTDARSKQCWVSLVKYLEILSKLKEDS